MAHTLIYPFLFFFVCSFSFLLTTKYNIERKKMNGRDDDDDDKDVLSEIQEEASQTCG